MASSGYDRMSDYILRNILDNVFLSTFDPFEYDRAVEELRNYENIPSIISRSMDNNSVMGIFQYLRDRCPSGGPFGKGLYVPMYRIADGIILHRKTFAIFLLYSLFPRDDIHRNIVACFLVRAMFHYKYDQVNVLLSIFLRKKGCKSHINSLLIRLHSGFYNDYRPITLGDICHWNQYMSQRYPDSPKNMQQYVFGCVLINEMVNNGERVKELLDMFLYFGGRRSGVIDIMLDFCHARIISVPLDEIFKWNEFLLKN